MDFGYNPCIIDGLRSGLHHRRFTLLSTDSCLNSTRNNSMGIHTMEFSTVGSPDPDPNRGLDSKGSQMESLFSIGVGVRQIRTSEDDYDGHEDIVQRDYENFYGQVEKFGLEHHNQVNWKETFESEFKRIDTLLMKCLSKLGLVGSNASLMRVCNLKSTLQNYRIDLWKRARDNMDNPLITDHLFSMEGRSSDCDVTGMSENTLCLLKRMDHSISAQGTICIDDVFSEESDSSEDISGILSPSLPNRAEGYDHAQCAQGILCNGPTPIRPGIGRLSTNLMNLEDAENEGYDGDHAQCAQGILCNGPTPIRPAIGRLSTKLMNLEDAENEGYDGDHAQCAQGILCNGPTPIRPATGRLSTNLMNIEDAENERLIPSTLTDEQSVITDFPVSAIVSCDKSTNDSNFGIMRTAQNVCKHNIISLVAQLKGKTKVVITRNSAEMLIKESKSQSIPSIERIMNACYTALEKYVTFSDVDQKVCQSAMEAIEKATVWIQNVTDLYIDSEIYSLNACRSMAIDIEKFTGNGSQTIYEFFQDFDSTYKGQGSEKQKADKLYRCHLSEGIKSMTCSISSDFAALKSFLLSEYGDFITVTESLVQNAEGIPKPPHSDYSARAEYFLKVEAMLEKLLKLKNQEGVDAEELMDHVYSLLFMKRLVDLLPTEDELAYTKMIARRGCDTRKITGEYAFNELRRYCSYEGAANERVAARCRITKPVDESEFEAAHVTNKKQVWFSSDKETPAVNSVQRKRVNVQKSSMPKYDREWANGKWKIPCGLPQHDHEVTGCLEFFSLSPSVRRSQTARKICWTCLGPRHMCRQEKIESGKMRVNCSNYQRVRPLVCKDCVKYSKIVDATYPPINMLLCTRRDHYKPPVDKVSRLLKNYLPALDITNFTPNLVASRGSSVKSYLTAPSKPSKSRPVQMDEVDMAVNTLTGEKHLLERSAVLTQHTSPTIYITQWIQVGTSKCLCFFDTGADIHMVDGEMAEKEGLEVVSKVQTTLKVVGGKELDTDYGKYKLNLGPTPEQKFQELTCYGMSMVAGPFPRYGLQDINTEVRAQQIVPAEYVLPEYVAGSKVHLLIGINESAAHPIHIATLPSGISVYRSPFKDIFGSNICYGGSHESFRASRVLSGTNNAVFLINTLNVVKDSMLISAKDTVKANESNLLPLSVHDLEVKAKDALGSSVSRSRTRATTPNRDPRSRSQSGQSCLGSTVSRSQTRAPAPKKGCLPADNVDCIWEHHDGVVCDPSILFHARSQSHELNVHPPMEQEGQTNYTMEIGGDGLEHVTCFSEMEYTISEHDKNQVDLGPGSIQSIQWHSEDQTKQDMNQVDMGPGPVQSDQWRPRDQTEVLLFNDHLQEIIENNADDVSKVSASILGCATPFFTHSFSGSNKIRLTKQTYLKEGQFAMLQKRRNWYVQSASVK